MEEPLIPPTQGPFAWKRCLKPFFFLGNWSHWRVVFTDSFLPQSLWPGYLYWSVLSDHVDFCSNSIAQLSVWWLDYLLFDDHPADQFYVFNNTKKAFKKVERDNVGMHEDYFQTYLGHFQNCMMFNSFVALYLFDISCNIFGSFYISFSTAIKRTSVLKITLAIDWLATACWTYVLQNSIKFL